MIFLKECRRRQSRQEDKAWKDFWPCLSWAGAYGGIGMAGAILMYGKTFPGSENFGYYVLNTLVMMAVALSLSYLIGLFVKNSNMLSGIANILSLGMCFLCGVFVPMNVMDRNVLKVSQFLPVYWYGNGK